MNNSDYEVAHHLALSEAINSNSKYLAAVYKELSQKVKDSNYLKALESF